mmetsp:Transcript_103917/g.298602  ORF Transcript_103917/g.298602 Transcript_103917/m.298602 type:complete len:238 (+) Transcript_103917:90-803(+)
MPTLECSRDAGSRYEGRMWPDVYNLSTYEDNFSSRTRAPKYKFPKAEGVARSRSASELVGPGEYRIERQFPIDLKREGCSLLSADLSLSSSFGCEPRVAADGAMKGISTSRGNMKTNPLGPGEYGEVDPAVGHKVHANYSFSKAVETADQVRARKANQGVPGPGMYPHRTPLSQVGEALAETQRGTKKIKRRHQAQWGAIFSATKVAKSPAAAGGPQGELAKMTEKDVVGHYLSFGR